MSVLLLLPALITIVGFVVFFVTLWRLTHDG